jgi:hypothetical protein
MSESIMYRLGIHVRRRFRFLLIASLVVASVLAVNQRYQSYSWRLVTSSASGVEYSPDLMTKEACMKAFRALHPAIRRNAFCHDRVNGNTLR